nr:uncharacterized protein LOC128685277 [Cherax quadricarinatus]
MNQQPHRYRHHADSHAISATGSHEATEQRCFGLSFATLPTPRAGIALISSFDFFRQSRSRNLPDLSTFRGALLPALVSLFSKNHHLPRHYQLALSSLKSNTNIVILSSDKGNSVVILDREDYLRKADVLLSDSRTYTPLVSNPLDRIKRTFNKKLRTLYDLCPPDFDLVQRFRVICPSLPYFYGLPKTHKPDIPLRPIISSRGSVSYSLASWLAKILTPFLGTFSPAHLRHFQDFIERVHSLPTCKMLSLDVESLFTNVPLDDVLDFLREKAHEGFLHLPIPTDVFLDLIRLCVDSNSFSFQGKYYSQTFGVAMGSPLSPVLANLYMENFKTVLLPTLDVQPSLWLRYVDDIFALWPHDSSLFQPFLEALNDLAPSIKFKAEWESNSLLPFLDFHVHRSDTGFSFSVYRKPMHSGMYIHYYSYHASPVKKSVLISLFLHSLLICDPQFLPAEISTLHNSFSHLGYPSHFIDSALSHAKCNFFSPKLSTPGNSSILCLPYISGLSNLNSSLRPLDIKLTFRQTNTLSTNLVHTSPPSTDVPDVYSISCSCPLQYFRETGRSLSDRLREHKNSVRLANTNNALFCHVRDHSHPVDWSSAKTVFPTSNSNSCCLVESSIIHNFPCMNLSPGFVSVDAFLSHYIVKCSQLQNTRDLT